MLQFTRSRPEFTLSFDTPYFTFPRGWSIPQVRDALAPRVHVRAIPLLAALSIPSTLIPSSRRSWRKGLHRLTQVWIGKYSVRYDADFLPRHSTIARAARHPDLCANPYYTRRPRGEPLSLHSTPTRGPSPRAGETLSSGRCTVDGRLQRQLLLTRCRSTSPTWKGDYAASATGRDEGNAPELRSTEYNDDIELAPVPAPRIRRP